MGVAKKCIEAGWSTAELEAEIARRFGTRREGGRRRKIPPDLTGFLVQLEVLCMEWTRWKDELSRDPDDLAEKHILLTEVPEKLRKQIQAVSKQISTLHRGVVEELKRVQPGRRIRSGLQTGADDPESAARR